jgi:protease-4
MRRLLKWIGGILLVMFALIGVTVLIGAVAIGFGLREMAKFEHPTPEKAVLTLDIGDGLAETTAGNPLVFAGFDKRIGLDDIVRGLAEAGRDPRIRGLVVKLGGGALNLAQASEIGAAVREFRATGKFALAFAETFGEAGDGNTHYLLATAFDQIWMQPSGSLGLTGMRLETPFLRSALADLGIEPRMDRRREYKGAVDTFISDSMPAPLRENLQRLVDSLVAQIASAIAPRLEGDAAAARALIDRGPFLPEDALAAKLVDRLGYWDEFESEVDSLSQDGEGYRLADYARGLEPPADAARVAIVYGLGPVMLGESDEDPLLDSWSMGAKTVSEAIREARLDPAVKAIIFRIDSPGGSYVAADTIWREVDQARRSGKPIVVSMGGVAASGGYFVAAPASLIVADPTTITGSIGVFSGKFLLTGLWDKLGIRWDAVQAGSNADMSSFNADYSPEGWAKLQAELDRIYADFVGKVSAGRKLDPAAVEAIAKGQVWSGADAEANGLVDRLGGLGEAVKAVRELLGLAPDAAVALVPYPAHRDGFAALLERFTGTRSLTGTLLELAAALREIRAMLGLDRLAQNEPRLEMTPLRPAP